ncbi:hypothetical protein [Longimycelium tulufanense]|uniref:hypothetical protein n=1 Tax=Longimycelium tulufanense TaxID=907463 RepID=UPI001663C53B|nr:hypothetical protein [Longimycelium tulufanense]
MHLCEAPTRKGWPCRRRVRPATGPCHLHRDLQANQLPTDGARPTWTVPAQRLVGETCRATLPPPRTGLVLPTPRRLEERSQCAAVAERAASIVWRRAATQRYTRVVGTPIWETLCTGRAALRCRRLAVIARGLLALRTRSRAAAGTLVHQVLRLRRNSTIERFAAARIGERIGVPGREGVAATARALQALGILLCTSDNDLTSCACLRDVADTVEMIEAELSEFLWRAALDELTQP